MGRSENILAWRPIPGNVPWDRYIKPGQGRPLGSYRAQRRNMHFERPKRGNRTPAFRVALAAYRAELAANAVPKPEAVT